jgi:hypothetical protein
MARIHGISGSTRYLLNGTRPIHGKRLASLTDITQFLDNYQEILAEAELVEAKRQDEIILALENRETELNQQLEADIKKRTEDVLTRIIEIHDKIEASESFFTILVYLIQFWGANWISSYRIHLPFIGAKWNIRRHKKHKEKTIAAKPQAIRSACKDIIESQQFLTRNNLFLIGAKGEHQVIDVLSRLPDEYHILNGVNLHFFDPIYWWKRKDKIRYFQIDPIVIGPTGLFLVGSKDWKGADIQIKTGDLKRQVRLANHALWVHMKDEYRFYERNPKIRCVIVSLQGSHADLKIDTDIDVIALDRLPEYVTARESTLSAMNIDRLIYLIPFREAH